MAFNRLLSLARTKHEQTSMYRAALCARDVTMYLLTHVLQPVRADGTICENTAVYSTAAGVVWLQNDCTHVIVNAVVAVISSWQCYHQSIAAYALLCFNTHNWWRIALSKSAAILLCANTLVAYRWLMNQSFIMRLWDMTGCMSQRFVC